MVSFDIIWQQILLGKNTLDCEIYAIDGRTFILREDYLRDKYVFG